MTSSFSNFWEEGESQYPTPSVWNPANQVLIKVDCETGVASSPGPTQKLGKGPFLIFGWGLGTRLKQVYLPTPMTVSQCLFLFVAGSFDLSYTAYSAPAKHPPAPTSLHDVQSGTCSPPRSIDQITDLWKHSKNSSQVNTVHNNNKFTVSYWSCCSYITP